MMNYEIFTQIYVLQGFNAKEAKRVEKTTKKMAKAGKWKISQHNLQCRDKTQGNRHEFVATSRTVSQQRPSRVQDDNQKIIATFHNYVTTQYEKKYRKNIATRK